MVSLDNLAVFIKAVADVVGACAVVMNQLRVSDGMLIKHLIERDVTSGLLVYVLKLSAQGTVTFSHEI